MLFNKNEYNLGQEINEEKKVTVLEQLESSYYDGESGYIPVKLKDVRTGPYCGSDLFFRSVSNKKDQYALYIKGRNIFDNERTERLVRNNIANLFVQKNGSANYMHFIEANLKDVIIDKNEDKDVKAKVACQVGMQMMQELMIASRLDNKNMARAMEWVFLTVSLLQENDYVYSNLAKIMENDSDVFKHSVNVTVMGLLFAKYSGLDIHSMNKLGIGLFLHDIGMIKSKSNKLADDPNTLETGNDDITHTHPASGYSMLAATKKLTDDTLDIILQHHENVDGTGYPYNLNGDEIHFLSKYARIVDEYDTLMYNSDEEDFVDRHFNTLTTMITRLKDKFDNDLLKQFACFLATKHGGRYILNEFNSDTKYKVAI